MAGKKLVWYKGFTLIELLVVIAIVGLLIGILMPVLSSVRATARSTTCLSNQKNIGVAFELYMDAHKGYYPRPIEGKTNPYSKEQRADLLWFNALDKYLGDDRKRKDAKAESRHLLAIKQDPAWHESMVEDRTYKMNSAFADDANEVYRTRRNGVRRPCEVVLLGDGRASDVSPADSINCRRFDLEENIVALRHPGETANVLFCDGHCETIKQVVRRDLKTPGWYAEGNDEQILRWSLK